jgi:triosephosphate isomerase
LKGLAKADIERCEIAYEPVWAIGTGMNAAPAQIDQVHRTIRRFLARQVGQTSAERLRILYGGSVKPENSREIAVLDEVNGLLVGGAGLKIETFWPVVEAFD